MRSRGSSGSAKKARGEVVVIGAGAVGAACASALARARLRVRVLSHAARSTTGMSGGHLLLQTKRPGLSLDLAVRSLELLTEFAAGREEELLLRREGSLILATTAAEEEALRAHYETLRAAGVPLEWLDGDAVRSLEPGVSPSVRAASFCPVDAQVHPPSLAAAWLQDALAHGAAVTSPVMVESFVFSGGAVCGVVAGGVEYPAAAVVLAAGPWSGEIAGMAGAAVDVRPRRGILMRGHSARPLASRPLLGAEYLASKFADGACSIAFSFQQHPNGECILGGSREFAGFSTDGLEKVTVRMWECGSRYLPAVNEVTWESTSVGFRPWTPDGLPRIGPSQVPGLYLACGHEGDGVTLAAATAERLTAALVGAV